MPLKLQGPWETSAVAVAMAALGCGETGAGVGGRVRDSGGGRSGVGVERTGGGG